MEIPLITKYDINGYQIRVIVTDEKWKQNCYLITAKESGDQVLVDPGSNELLLKKMIVENGLGNLKYILLTHAHFDHIGAAYAISNAFGLPCIIQKSDMRLLNQATIYALRFGGKPVSVPKDVVTFDQDIELKFGDEEIKVFFTPGHTLGSVSYGFNGFILTGDTLLKNFVGRVDLPGGSASIIKNSVELLLNNLPKETIIFGGHGKPWDITNASLWWNEAKTSLPQHNMFTH